MSSTCKQEIQCPCGRFIIGKGRGEEAAWKQAENNYLDHLQREGTGVLDMSDPNDRARALQTIARLLNTSPIA